MNKSKELDLSKHVSLTYQKLRRGVAVVAFFYPILLWLGGKLKAGLTLQGSMSAYYHANTGSEVFGDGVMRDLFVGVLFAVGIVLFLYKGYSSIENQVLNLAGVLALGIAIFPMDWADVSSGEKFSLHGVFAISFFFCIAYICIFRACDTIALIKDEKKRKRYSKYYKTLGFLMILSPVLAFLFSVFFDHRSGKNSLVFFVEVAGIYVFAAYWWLKGREISETNSDKLAVLGNLEMRKQKIKDVFHLNSVKIKNKK